MESDGDKLITAAFAEISRRGMRGLTVSMLAKKAGMTVAEAYKVAPDMASLLDVYAERIDAEVAEELAREAPEGPWRERLFDAFMRRFDQMLKDRDALRVIVIEESRDYLGLPRTARRVRRSIARLLGGAGLSEDPLVARAASVVLIPLYASVLKVWLNDEPDQAKTMAALDKALRRVEGWLARFEPVRRRFGEDREEPAEGTAAAPIEPVPASETKH